MLVDAPNFLVGQQEWKITHDADWIMFWFASQQDDSTEPRWRSGLTARRFGYASL